MALPRHEWRAGIHLFDWDADGVRIRLDRMRESSDGSVKGEVSITKTDIPDGELVEADRLTLNAPRSRKEVANFCNDRVPGYDWAAMISQAATLAIRRHREGEPAVDLATMERQSGTSYLIEPFLLEHQPNLIFGDGGLGKSIFALYCAVLVASGASTKRFMVQPGNVGYLDYEADKDETSLRHEMISTGLEIEKPPMTYRFCHEALSNDVQAVQTLVAEHDIQLLIVDSAGPACSGKPEGAEETIAFFRALRSLKVTSLIVAHVSKGGGPRKGPYGCYSSDTEVLTKAGWKPHPEVALSDEVACFNLDTEYIEWQRPTEVHNYEYQGEMVHFTGQTKGSLDILVTPNHRMVVKPDYKLPVGTKKPYRNPREWHYKEARQLLGGSAWFFPYASNGIANVEQTEISPAFARFLGWWLSEGSLDGNAPVLTQAVGQVADAMRETVEALGYDSKAWYGKSRPHEQTVMQLRLRKATGLGKWLKAECGKGAPNKRIPRFLFSASLAVREALFAALIEGDGSLAPNGRMRYSSSSRQLADDVQMLAITLGYAARVVFRPRPQLLHLDQWVVHIDPRRQLSIRPRNVETVDYEGTVHCLTVPTGAYITRRNGYMAVAGNSPYWVNLPRSVWEVRKSQKMDADSLEFSLWHRKINSGKLRRPMAYRIDFQNPATVFHELDVRDSQELSEGLPMPERITALLARGALDAESIAETLDAKTDLVRVTLSRGKNRFVRLGEGKWGNLTRDVN